MRAFSILALLAGLLAAPAYAKPPSLQAFIHDPEFSGPTLSPDGKALAAIYNAPDKSPAVVVLDLDTRKAVQLSSDDQELLISPVWLNNEWLLYAAAPSQWDAVPVPSLIAIKRDGSQSSLLSTGHMTVAAISHPVPMLADPEILGSTTSSPPQVYVSGVDIIESEIRAYKNKDEKQEAIRRIVASTPAHVYRINAATGTAQIVATSPPGQISDWILDNHGEPRCLTSTDEDGRAHIMVRASGSMKWRELASYGLADPELTPLAFTPDNKHLYVLTEHDGETQALYAMDIKTGKLGKPLFARKTVDVGLVMFSNKGKLIAGVYDDGRTKTHYFNPHRARVMQALKAALPDDVLDVDFDRDGKRALVTAWSDRNPGYFYLYHADTRKLERLFPVNDAISPDELSRMRGIEVKARDGLMLHGYLTRPEHHKQVGLVVMVHGGPFGVRDYWGYDSAVQILASHGYAVLQVNFRGSGGYGTDFRKMGWKQWGRAMEDDVADATRWAIRKHYARAGHVCIYGASYGGYAALMGLIRYPSLYACGASFAGVTDLNLLARESAKLGFEGRNIWFREAIGDGKRDAASLRMNSPANLVDRIKAPLFIAQGTIDETVPPEHAQRLVDSLRAHGVGADLLYLSGQPHGFVDNDKEILFYKSMLDFLDKYLGSKDDATIAKH
ncbi:MAG: prolyl oligopeptidase family serine peptidase [Gammaproteobacteria bacterium]